MALTRKHGSEGQNWKQQQQKKRRTKVNRKFGPFLWVTSRTDRGSRQTTLANVLCWGVPSGWLPAGDRAKNLSPSSRMCGVFPYLWGRHFRSGSPAPLKARAKESTFTSTVSCHGTRNRNQRTRGPEVSLRLLLTSSYTHLLWHPKHRVYLVGERKAFWLMLMRIVRRQDMMQIPRRIRAEA